MQTSMTLDHYLFGQNEPERMPNVILKEGEYWMGGFIKYGAEQIAPITINNLPYSYVIVKGSTTLRTQDNYGNPKGYSCFHLPFVP